MLRLALIVGVVGGLSAPHVCRADHILQFRFEGVITSIGGNIAAPSHIHVGDPISLMYIFDSSTADADPFDGVGSYAAISSADAHGDGSPFGFLAHQMNPITVIDNSALGDVYRVSMARTGNRPSRVSLELIDAESGAFSSDALPTSLALTNYDGQFDIARITIESGPVDAYWSVTGTIETLESNEYSCRCDWNGSDNIDSQDYFDFLTAFFSGGGDYNHDGITNTQDFFDFLTCFFSHPDCD